MTNPKFTEAQLHGLAQVSVVLTPTGSTTASGQPTATVAYGEADAPVTTATYTPGAAGEQPFVLADAALLATAPTVPVTTPLAPAAPYPANNSTPHPLDKDLLVNPAARQPAPDPVPPVVQPHQAVPASVAQAWPAPYPPQTWAQPRTMVKWVGLGLLLGVLAALPKAPPPRRRTAICRHCGSAHLPGMGAAPAWSV